MRARFWLGWVASAVLALGCGQDESGGGGSGAASTEPIKVGHFASLTGDTASFGQSSDKGIRMAIEEINAKGGVLGRPIEIISEDDRSITEEARTAALKLIQRDEVVALLGEISSSRSLAAAPEAQRAQIPMISPGSTNPDVTKIGDYVFRACFIDPFQGSVMARFAVDELKVKRAAVLFDYKQDYSVGLAAFFRDKFKQLGGEIVGDAVEGYYFSNHYAPESEDPKVQAFVAKYKEKYGSVPDAMAALGYDSAGILADALTRAGTTENVKLRDAIAATKDYPGVTGSITMDADRNAQKGAVVLKIENKRFNFYRSVPAS